MNSDLSIIIPAYNEENGIGKTLHALKAVLSEAEIIVVDDGSSDQTLAHARSVDGVVVIPHLFNRGYGAALKTGMLQATRGFIAWFDADGEHRVEDLISMAAQLRSSHLAAVIGRRSTSSTHLRRIGKWCIGQLAKLLGTDLGSDVNCGLRVFRREAIMPYLDVLPNAFSASLTSTMTMVERGYPIAFYPILTNPRIGQSKVRLAHGMQTLYLVLRTVMLFAPLRIFFPLGMLIMVAGAAWGAMTAFGTGRGFSTLGGTAVLFGFFTVALGLIADQISQMRLGQLNRLSRTIKSNGEK